MSTAGDLFGGSAYGLHVRSALPLPDLLPHSSGAGADVYVYPGTLVPPAPDEMETYYFTRSDERGAYYFAEGIGGLLARGGREIVVDPLPGAAGDSFHHLVCGIGLGLVLHQRGTFTLHASAVAVGGGAVAFVGRKGAGKSTTAAAFYGAGHRVVSDDLLAVRIDEAGATVLPGLPSLKLWPEAARAALGDDPEALPRLHPEAEKRARITRSDFDPAPLPLLAVYALDYAEPGAGPTVEPLSAREAYIELVRHDFALRILGGLGESLSLFRQRVRIACQVPVRRLLREHRLGGLAEIVGCVEEDVASIAATMARAA